MSRGFWTPLTEITSKWCGMFWRSTTKVFILNKEESLLTSLGRHYSFRRGLLFCFFCPFLLRDNFFAVEELSSVHGSKCMWTLVPRCRRCIMGPNPFEIAFLVLVICIRFDKWSEVFYKNFKKSLWKSYKGFQMRIHREFGPIAYLPPPPTTATLPHSHSHSSRWDSNSAANAAAAAAGCKQPPPPPASSY